MNATKTNTTEIYATRDSDGPSRGATVHVTKDGGTLYWGHDLSYAFEIFAKHAGRKMTSEERKLVSCEADAISRSRYHPSTTIRAEG
jgi:hypothetical protein